MTQSLTPGLTILTSDTEEIEIMYIVTPTSTAGPVSGGRTNDDNVNLMMLG